MGTSDHLKKFALLIKHVLAEEIVISENNVEKLLACLSDCKQNSPGKLLLESYSFKDLIFNTIACINNASPRVQLLLIKLATTLFKSELQFTKMQTFQKSPLKVCILNKMNNTTPPELHLACLNLLITQVKHCTGVHSMIEFKVWKYTLYPDILNRPKQISEAAYNFTAKLVWKLQEYNLEMELMEVLEYIVEPILNSEYLVVATIDTETDTILADKVFAHMSGLLAVLSEVDSYPPVNKVISLLKEYFIIDLKIFEIFLATKNSDLLRLINAVVFRYFYGILRHLLFNKEIDDFCNKMTAFHRNYIAYAIQKREAFVIIDFIIQSNIMWSNIEKVHSNEFNFPLTFERNGKKVEYSLQIFIHLLVPMMKNYLILTDTAIKVVEEFVIKMGKSLAEYIFASCYTLADFLKETGANYRLKVTIHSLKEILRLKGHLNQSQTGPLFQGLYYLLEIFISRDETGELVLNNRVIGADELRMLTHLLNALKMLLKEYHISWYENVEIVSIQADLLNLLQQKYLTTKHVAQVLDVLDICVQKFLSPNMSLLVDIKSTQSNTLNDIGKAIKLYAQFDDWEVRDSALNLLNSCIEISFIKYVPLQKIIRENNLLILAAKASLSDPDFYSQCTALKCLFAATNINFLWQTVLTDDENIYLHLIWILRNHTEGNVRAESINVLNGVYTNQKITPRFQTTLYEVMMTAAIDDLHWEVQLTALTFWKHVIDKHFSNRGMLDGKFPTVTFSKEKRKIVVLHEREIQKQLIAIMKDLANIGCLTVLLKCMNELHNITVMEKAYGIVKGLIETLDLYNFRQVIAYEDNKSIIPLKKYETTNTIDTIKVISEEERNVVIDSILSESQNNLLISLHDRYKLMKTEEMDIETEYYPRKELVNTKEFLETFYINNFALIIDNKKKYNADNIHTLDGLLDEFLSSREL